MLGKNLETVLNGTFKSARANHERYMTTEHMLLGILEARYLKSSLRSANIPYVEMCAELKAHLLDSGEKYDSGEDTQPTVAFQRTLQRAVLEVQTKNDGAMVSAKHVLNALLKEEETFAKRLLTNHKITAEIIDLLPFEIGMKRKKLSADAAIAVSAHAAGLRTENVEALATKLDTAMQMIKSLEIKLDALNERLDREG